MPNIYEPKLEREEGWLRARIGDDAGCDQLGASLYELAPGERTVFHYHVQREELLIVLSGRVALRTAVGATNSTRGRSCRSRGASAAPTPSKIVRRRRSASWW
jgi:uncharacterized cupin superfamily protein